MSPWAVASLVCAIAGPVAIVVFRVGAPVLWLPVAAIVFGVVALARRGSARSRSIATAGIAVGILELAAFAALAWLVSAALREFLS